jgi:hypothetical protein
MGDVGDGLGGGHAGPPRPTGGRLRTGTVVVAGIAHAVWQVSAKSQVPGCGDAI